MLSARLSLLNQPAQQQGVNHGGDGAEGGWMRPYTIVGSDLLLGLSFGGAQGGCPMGNSAKRLSSVHPVPLPTQMQMHLLCSAHLWLQQRGRRLLLPSCGGKHTAASIFPEDDVLQRLRDMSPLPGAAPAHGWVEAAVSAARAGR